MKLLSFYNKYHERIDLAIQFFKNIKFSLFHDVFFGLFFWLINFGFIRIVFTVKKDITPYL